MKYYSINVTAKWRSFFYNCKNIFEKTKLQYHSLFMSSAKCYILKTEVMNMSQDSINKYADRYKRIGLNIALQRKMKGLTQIQLAEKIGISRTHMSNIEAPNMLTPVSLEVIFEIADALNIKPEVLFVMSDE